MPSAPITPDVDSPVTKIAILAVESQYLADPAARSEERQHDGIASGLLSFTLLAAVKIACSSSGVKISSSPSSSRVFGLVNILPARKAGFATISVFDRFADELRSDFENNILPYLRCVICGEVIDQRILASEPSTKAALPRGR
jgi:hypothetical protein